MAYFIARKLELLPSLSFHGRFVLTILYSLEDENDSKI